MQVFLLVLWILAIGHTVSAEGDLPAVKEPIPKPISTVPEFKEPLGTSLKPISTAPGPKEPFGTSVNHEICPAPSAEILRCIRQWACQYAIRLDLRCLFNLNGNPLIGGLVGSLPTAPGTGKGGLLGNLLGING